MSEIQWVTARSTEVKRFVLLTEDNMLDVLREIPHSTIRWDEKGDMVASVAGYMRQPGDWIDNRGNTTNNPHTSDMWEVLG